MTFFDTSLEAPRIEEQQSTPIIPEDRFIFELIGFEKSDPDQWRKDGGIKWTFRVYDTDGRPFEFKDEPYDFYRTTGLTRDGRPNFNIGTYGNEWAAALLGRDLGVDANFSVSELRNKRMSAMVVWENQRSDPKKKTIKLASLRHVPVQPVGAQPARSATPPQVTADATSEDVDRMLMLSKLQKKIARAEKKKLISVPMYQQAYEMLAAGQGSMDDIERNISSLDDYLDAMDD